MFLGIVCAANWSPFLECESSDWMEERGQSGEGLRTVSSVSGEEAREMWHGGRKTWREPSVRKR